jgi:hypothetical protein
MRTSTAALVLLVCSSTSTAIAQQGSFSARAEAAAVCESGAGSGYGHASNACWIAHEQALSRYDEERALAYARLGCSKYRRSDQCFLVALTARDSRRGAASRSAAAQRKVEGEVERAAHWLFPADYEDGEAGVIFYDLLRTRVLTRPK